MAEFKKLNPNVPTDPREQLRGAILAVFRSWNNDRAIRYRSYNGIPDEWGTAVSVQVSHPLQQQHPFLFVMPCVPNLLSVLQNPKTARLEVLIGARRKAVRSRCDMRISLLSSVL